MNIIQVNNLTKHYGTLTAVDHISFQLEQGTMLGFLGINGAGKSTAINMLSTLLHPDEGSATVCGHILGREDQQIRRKIGIVYQQNVLDELLTVRENLMCRGLLHGITRTQARAQLDKLTNLLKLEDILKKRYQLLSGGQKRRCEIAAALMHTPQILFLDEPTTGLDPATRKDVWEIIETLRRDEQMTVFLTTHYMEEAANADRIIILDKGRIIDEGTPYELKDRHARDKLRLYCDTPLPIAGQVTPFGMEVPLMHTLDALAIVEQFKDQIQGFEVIQGNMDDVFLNAVGQGLEE